MRSEPYFKALFLPARGFAPPLPGPLLVLAMAPARTLVAALAVACLCANAAAFAPSRHAGLPAVVGLRRSVRRSAPWTPSMALFDELADGFNQMISGGGKVEAEPALPTVVIEPDFKLAAITTALALVLDSIPYVGHTPAIQQPTNHATTT